VRKSLWDWILFRSRAGIRARLFGPADHPTVRVSTADKSGRLGAPAKEAMKRAADRARGNIFADWNEAIRGGVLAEQAAAVAKSLRETIEQRTRSLSDRITKLEKDIRTIADHSERIQILGRATQDTAERLEELRVEHAEVLGDALLVPAARGELAEVGSVGESEGEDESEESLVVLEEDPERESSR